VKGITASRDFYEKPGFSVIGDELARFLLDRA